MRELAGGQWYEPADLGFDSLVIGAAATGAGNIVPWCQGFSFSRVVFFFELVAGPSASFNLRIRTFDIDGQTILINVSTVATVLALDAAVFFSGNSGTPQSSSGSASVTALGPVTGSPYAQFLIFNNDGANAGTVSLRAFLGK